LPRPTADNINLAWPFGGSQLTGKLKRKKERLVQANSDRAESVRAAIETVVQTFVKGDRAIEIQSSDLSGFYLSYGYLYVCRVFFSAADDNHVIVALQKDAGDESTVYSGSFNKLKIQSAVKEALLDWYTSLF
jgi:hypothetical protein